MLITNVIYNLQTGREGGGGEREEGRQGKREREEGRERERE